MPKVQRQPAENISDVASLFTKISSTIVPPKVASSKTVQRSNVVQRTPTRTPLPLAKKVSRAESKVQRVEAATASSSTEETPATVEDVAESGPDLMTLARQIYPLLKRMLAVERERR